MVYKAEIEWFLQNDSQQKDTQPCEVKFNEKKIEIYATKKDPYEAVNYTGTEIEPGHYNLFEEDFAKSGVHATLHRSEGSLLEGSFISAECCGMWRIKLGELKGNSSDN